MKKRLLALVLALTMLISVLPTAFAEEPVTEPTVETPVEGQPVEQTVANEQAPENESKAEQTDNKSAEDALVIEETEKQPVREAVVNKYKIEFDSNGGSEVATIADIPEGGSVDKPADPTKYGYDFDGWYPEFPTTVKQDYKLTAQWRPKKVQVSWDAGEASGSYQSKPEWDKAPEKTEIDFGTEITRPATTPTLEGYEQNGWKYVGNKTESSPTIDSEGPITVTAQWKILKVNVAFESGSTDKTVTPPDDLKDQDYGFTLAVPDDLEWEGHTFKGWIMDGAVYTEQAIKKNVTLVGSWETDQVTVNFYTDKDSETPYATKTIDYGTDVTLPTDPTDEGRTFSTWQLADGSPFVVTGIKANVDVFAKWDVDTHTVTFELAGGTGEDKQFADQTVVYNEKAKDPGEPEKFGYHFTGWKNGDQDFTFDTPITEDITLTAQWKGNKYNLVIDTSAIKEDVMVGHKAFENPAAEIEEYSAEANKFAVPVISAQGHDFTGYTYAYTDEDGKEQKREIELEVGNLELTDDMVFIPADAENEHALVLTPVSEKDYYIVTYSADVGEEKPSETGEMVVYAPEDKINPQTGLKAVLGKDQVGKIFTIKGEKKYLEGFYTDDKFNTKWNFEDDVTDHMTLYAKLLDLRTVTFDPNGGELKDLPESEFIIKPDEGMIYALIPDGMSYNEFVKEGLPKPVLDKNTFEKWLYLGEDYDGTQPITENITLVAQWAPTYYDVVIDPANGTEAIKGKVLDSESIDATESITVPDLKDGGVANHIFAGWFLADKEGKINVDGEPYTFNTPVTEPITVRAGWIEAEVLATYGGKSQLYKTLAEAAALSNGNYEIELLKDVDLGETVLTFGGAHEIDMGGYTLTGSMNSTNGSATYGIILSNGTLSNSQLTGIYSIKSGTYINVKFCDKTRIFEGKFDDATRETIKDEYIYKDAKEDQPTFDKYMLKKTAASNGYYVLVPYVTLSVDQDNGPDPFSIKIGQDDPTDYEHNFGTEEEPSDVPVKKGFDFVGWVKIEEGKEAGEFTWGDPVTENTSIKAKWQQFHTVTFNWNDDDKDPTTTEVKVNHGEKVSAPEEIPAREGKVFEFWGTKDPWIEYDFTRPVEQDITLIAKWEFEVTFDPNNGEDPITVNVKNLAQVDASKVPQPTRDDGSTFTGWYYSSEGEPTTVYSFSDQINADRKIVAVWNNTAWQIESVYENLANGYTKTPTELSYSGSEEKPITLIPAIGSESEKVTAGKYYLAYRFEAPNGITASNAHLYSIYYNGAWQKLSEVLDTETSTINKHPLISMFEEVSIDAMKQWADAGEPKVFTYKFARTADKDDETKVTTLTVTFDPNYVEFKDAVGQLVFNVTDYKYIYDVQFDHYAGETRIIDSETAHVTSCETISESPKLDEYSYWTAVNPKDWPDDLIDYEKRPERFNPETKITENMTLYAFSTKPDLVTIKPSLNLLEEIGINFYFQVERGDFDEYKVHVTYNSGYQTIDKEYAFRELKFTENGWKLVALSAGSDEMSDEVTLNVYRGEEIVIKDAKYSINSIANGWLEDGKHGDLAGLLKAMLQYGHYAENDFSHNAGKTAIPAGAPALAPIPSDYAPGTDPDTLADYIDTFQCGLALDSAVGMNIYITPKEGYGLEDFKIEVANATIAPPAMSGDRIKAKVTGIYPDQMLDQYSITITVDGKSATYTRSVMNCAYEIEQKGRFVQLVEALYQYSVEANKIF